MGDCVTHLKHGGADRGSQRAVYVSSLLSEPKPLILHMMMEPEDRVMPTGVGRNQHIEMTTDI